MLYQQRQEVHSFQIRVTVNRGIGIVLIYLLFFTAIHYRFEAIPILLLPFARLAASDKERYAYGSTPCFLTSPPAFCYENKHGKQGLSDTFHLRQEAKRSTYLRLEFVP